VSWKRTTSISSCLNLRQVEHSFEIVTLYYWHGLNVFSVGDDVVTRTLEDIIKNLKHGSDPLASICQELISWSILYSYHLIPVVWEQICYTPQYNKSKLNNQIWYSYHVLFRCKSKHKLNIVRFLFIYLFNRYLMYLGCQSGFNLINEL
jgi:hypothetical protein